MKNEKIIETPDIAAETVIESEPETTEGVAEATLMVDDAAVEKAIRKSVYLAMGAGIVPIPLFGFASLTAIHLTLVRQLSELYGVEFKESIAKKIIVSVTGAGAATLTSPWLAKAVIGIPLVGLPLAVGARPALSGLSTYAVGQMFVTHFRRGGTFVRANLDEMKDDFGTAVQHSRDWLGNTISGKKDAKPETASA